MKKLFSRMLLVVLVVLLQACASSINAPVQDLSIKNGAYQPFYTVVRGDTLFSIAMRYDLDYKKLAASNGIFPPYVIHPGDKIVLREQGAVVKQSLQVPVSKTYPVKNTVIVKESEKNTGNNSTYALKQNNTLTNVNESRASVTPRTSAAVKSVSGGGWIWPAHGSIIRQFSPQDALSKGIDIGGAVGTPVLAARSGEVVYAGSGLKGYGNLIIVRHDDTFISAYAHNRLMLVREGQQVKQGDRIAELGMSGTEAPKLHFEIRELGKPIDPLKYLPDK